MGEFKFDKIEEAIKDFKMGKPIIVADDEDRENEGDVLCSAQCVTPDIINFMAKECRGLICLAISPEIAENMNLPQMVDNNTEKMRTAFTLSVDAAECFGVTTGISAYDRAKTIEVVISKESRPHDLRRPGHVFPCVSRKGGVLTRIGHTEACVDMAILAGHRPAGVIIENITFEDIFAEDCYTAVRMLSVRSPIRNIRFKNLVCGCRVYALNLDGARYCATPLFSEAEFPQGCGQIEHILFDGLTVYSTGGNPATPLIDLETRCTDFVIRHFSCPTEREALHRPLLRVRNLPGFRAELYEREKSVPQPLSTVDKETLELDQPFDGLVIS